MDHYSDHVPVQTQGQPRSEASPLHANIFWALNLRKNKWREGLEDYTMSLIAQPTSLHRFVHPLHHIIIISFADPCMDLRVREQDYYTTSRCSGVCTLYNIPALAYFLEYNTKLDGQLMKMPYARTFTRRTILPLILTLAYVRGYVYTCVMHVLIQLLR